MATNANRVMLVQASSTQPLQPYKGRLNRRGKQMHLSIEARKHEAGRLLRGEEFKGNPSVYLPAKDSWTANGFN